MSMVESKNKSKKYTMKRRDFLYASICSAAVLSTCTLSADETNSSYHFSCPILKYGFINNDKMAKNLSVQALSTQLEFLYEQGYETFFLDEISSYDKKQKSVVLLFSIPDITITNYVLPLLRDYNMKATLVISPSHIGKSLFINGVNYPLLGDKEILDIENTGYFRIATLGTNDQVSSLKSNASWLHLNQKSLHIPSYLENDIIDFVRSDSVSLGNLKVKAFRMESLGELSLFKAYLKGV